jgi:protein involved in polysaccharide export with SLBB domain
MAVRSSRRWGGLGTLSVFIVGSALGCQKVPPPTGAGLLTGKVATPPAPSPGSETASEPVPNVPDHLLLPFESIRPLPPFEIPDDPAPHEGAMVGYPYIVEPPDLIRVEVLEALPGRPLTGERLVRPDGKVCLDFYGDLHVSGLTTDQIKIKVIMHLRKWIPDSTLGLIELSEFGVDLSEAQPMQQDLLPGIAASGTFPLMPFPPPKVMPGPLLPGEVPAVPAELSIADLPSVPAGSADPAAKVILIPPADSDRVFVDVTAYNSKVYYVEGDITAPGRLVCTGGETVFDAINYAGGFTSTSDPKNVLLVRPARGGKPAKVYAIDLEAIQEKGDPKANLQLFPGDRLVIGRYPTVRASVELARAAEPLDIMTKSLKTYADAMKALATSTGGAAMTPEQVEAIAKVMTEALVSKALASGEAARAEAEKTLREILLRRPAAKPE